MPKFVSPSDHKSGVLFSQGKERGFLYHIPKRWEPEKRISLHIVLHGGGGSAEGMIYLTRFSDFVDQEQMVVVYPEGVGKRWNDGRQIAHSLTDQLKTDDISFLEDLVHWFMERYPIDPNQVHLAGLSNGGFLSQRTACEKPNKFASFFSVGSTISKNTFQSCKNPESPIAVGMIFGKNDSVVPYLGGTVKLPNGNKGFLSGGEVLSWEDSILFWKNLLECKDANLSYPPNVKGRETREVLRSDFNQCKDGSKLRTYLIEKGEHIWPHGFYYHSESRYGYLSYDLNATQEIIRFQKENPKTNPYLSLGKD